MAILIGNEDKMEGDPWWPPPISVLAGLADAWPALFTSMMFLVSGLLGLSFLGVTRGYLVRMMQVEFLVIHAGAMLSAVALSRLTAPSPKTALWMGRFFWGLVVLYIMVSFSFARYGPLLFIHAIGVTFWGSREDWNRPGRFKVILVRWIITVIVYVIVIEVQHLPREVESWGDSRALHMAGFLNFAGLGLLEWAGLFRASWWKELEK